MPAGSDHGVRFVDEQNDRLRRSFDLGNNRLQPVLEFAFDAGPCLQKSHVQHAKQDVAQRRRHIPLGDFESKSLHDGGLADAGLAGEDGIVLAAAREDVDHLAYFKVAAEDRVNLPFLRAARKVDRKLVQRGSLGPGARCGSRSFRRCHARPELLVLGGTCNKRGEVFLQSLDRDVFELLGKIARQAPRVLIGQEGQQEMPGTHPVLPVVDGSERPGLFEEPGESRRKGRGAGVPRLQPVEGARQIPRHAGGVYFEVAENARQVGIRRLDQLEQQVLDFDVIMRARQTEARRSL